MSHEPLKPPVENPVALVLSGGRVEAVSLEEALRRYFYAGLERLADDPVADPARALEALADCTEAEFSRYNEENHPMRSDVTLN